MLATRANARSEVYLDRRIIVTVQSRAKNHANGDSGSLKPNRGLHCENVASPVPRWRLIIACLKNGE